MCTLTTRSPLHPLNMQFQSTNSSKKIERSELYGPQCKIKKINLNPDQCDQIGRFLKVICNKFCYKTFQVFGDLLGYIEKCHFICKNCSGHFLGYFWTKLGDFLLPHLVTLILAVPFFKENARRLNDKVLE